MNYTLDYDRGRKERGENCGMEMHVYCHGDRGHVTAECRAAASEMLTVIRVHMPLPSIKMDFTYCTVDRLGKGHFSFKTRPRLSCSPRQILRAIKLCCVVAYTVYYLIIS